MKKIKILVACATGVATSTIVEQKLKEICKKNKLNCEVLRCNMAQISNYISQVDIIMPTTRYSNDKTSKPIINALPFITGVNEEGLVNQLLITVDELVKS